MATPDEIRQALAAPFHPDELEWRVGATNREKTQGMALAYLTARAVMERLDEVVGIDGWEDEYRPGPGGGVVCRLKLMIGGFPITKEDGAENTDVEGVKGGLSDALKRAAVKFGIGRYLYGLPDQWIPLDDRGRFSRQPSLPQWALPESLRGKNLPEPEQRQEPQRSAPQQPSNADLPPVDLASLSVALKQRGQTVPDLAPVLGVPATAINDKPKLVAAILQWAFANNVTNDPVQALLKALPVKEGVA